MTGESADWKTHLGYTSPKYVESSVNEKNLRFYPMSVGMLAKLRVVAQPLVKALTKLFNQEAADRTRIERAVTSDQVIKTFNEKNEPIEVTGQDTEVIIEAVDPKLAKLRSEEKDRAMNDLVSSLLDENNLHVLADLVMDSLRDVFGQDKPPALEFVQQTPLPLMVEMLKGVVAANAGVVGPVGGKIKAAIEGALDKATQGVNDREEDQQSQQAEE